MTASHGGPAVPIRGCETRRDETRRGWPPLRRVAMCGERSLACWYQRRELHPQLAVFEAAASAGWATLACGTGREDRTLLSLLVRQVSSPDDEPRVAPEEGLAPPPQRFKAADPSIGTLRIVRFRARDVSSNGAMVGIDDGHRRDVPELSASASPLPPRASSVIDRASRTANGSRYGQSRTASTALMRRVVLRGSQRRSALADRSDGLTAVRTIGPST